MEEIARSLEQIGGKGSFWGMRTIPRDKLCLEIEGFGLLKFPLTSRTVRGLIDLATLAKFGWRDRTLLDKTVRNAWEISKNLIRVNANNEKRWYEALDSTLDWLKDDLGLPENVVLKAELHNLLIYDKGQFFSPHQDSEKADGMVASLVVVLPSQHRGGSLIVNHHGEKKEFKTDRFPQDKLSLMAFYADCHHEVKTVTAGYRVTLTYNLMLENKSEKAQSSLVTSVTSKTKQEENVIRHLRSYFADNDSTKETEFYTEAPKKCVYLLDHSYTQKGLSWKHLKNADRLRAEVLKKAAQTLNLEISMALADVQETWSCQVDYPSYGYHHYDEEEEYSEDEIECDDLVNSETILKYWIDEAGSPLNYGDHFVSDGYICWTKSTNDFKPFDSEYEGFMGNYGNTMDRWYHRAAVVLWQKKDHYPVLFDIDAKSVVRKLHGLSKKSAQEHQEHQEHKVSEILSDLLPYWRKKLHGNQDVFLLKEIFELALYVNNAILAKAMIENFNIETLSSGTAPLFILLCKLYGNSWGIDVFNHWASSKSWGSWNSQVKVKKIAEVVAIFATYKNSGELTNWLLMYQFEKIKEGDSYSQKHDNRVEILKNASKRINAIMELCEACFICQQRNIHLSLIHYIIQHSELYPPVALVSVILNSRKKEGKEKKQGKHRKQEKMSCDEDGYEKWGYQQLHKHVTAHLMTERDKGLRKPDDWSVAENIACTCKDCDVLKGFLRSRDSTTLTWPLAKDRRAHIHQAIDGLGIPVTHQTKHIGSPHKLILNKTEDLHGQAKQRFQEIEKALRLIF